MIRNDRQRSRARNRLAAARKSRSTVVNYATRARLAENGEFVAEHDDFQLFKVVRLQLLETLQGRDGFELVP